MGRQLKLGGCNPLFARLDRVSSGQSCLEPYDVVIGLLYFAERAVMSSQVPSSSFLEPSLHV